MALVPLLLGRIGDQLAPITVRTAANGRAAIWIMLTRLLISRPQQRDPAFLPRTRSVGFFIDFPQSPMSLPHSTENVDIAVARGFECSPLGELRDFGLGHTLLDDRCAGPTNTDLAGGTPRYDPQDLGQFVSVSSLSP